MQRCMRNYANTVHFCDRRGQSDWHYNSPCCSCEQCATSWSGIVCNTGMWGRYSGGTGTYCWWRALFYIMSMCAYMLSQGARVCVALVTARFLTNVRFMFLMSTHMFKSVTRVGIGLVTTFKRTCVRLLSWNKEKSSSNLVYLKKAGASRQNAHLFYK